MKSTYFCTLLGFLISITTYAQISKNEVLFTIDDDPVNVSEFLRVYNKNLDLVQDESQKDVDSYLTLFINYKLKLKEAKALGYDKKQSYVRELYNYTKQLAKNYLSDNQVTDELIAEAYDRTVNEVKASHILIKIPENASPQDTLMVYNKLLKLRERVLNEGFEKVQKDVHDGKTIFAENLGYFSCFKMVYDFENAAYSTKVGEVSMPFRTSFGYHIVKVFDKRKSRGTVTVGNIMIGKKQNDSLNESPETRIANIYKKLSQGEDFESLAKQFSDDKSSANNGGKMEPFTGGQLSSEIFEDKAFGLKNVGDISPPFETRFGWHIIKLYNKQNVGSFEELKPELEVKVKRDARSRLINDALLNKLKFKYHVPEKQPALSYFESILNDDYFKRNWTLPEDFQGSNPLVKIGDKQLTYSDFAIFLVNYQRNPKSQMSFKKLVSESYKAFLNANLVKYQEENLENENEEFANIVGEYRDGLLLFDLMEDKIWNTSSTDTLQIKEYYNNHKSDYYTNESIDAIVASSAKQKDIEKVSELLKTGKMPAQISDIINVNGNVGVIFTSGIMEKDNHAIPDGFDFQEGVSKIYEQHNAFIVVDVKKILPKEQQNFDDARGKIISDYQEYKEKMWLEELNKKYKVKINHDILSSIKNQINNQ